MISRVIWVLGGSVNRPRGAGLVSGSERSGPDPEGFVLYLRWRWFVLLGFALFSGYFTSSAGRQLGGSKGFGRAVGCSSWWCWGSGVPGDRASPAGGSAGGCGGGRKGLGR